MERGSGVEDDVLQFIVSFSLILFLGFNTEDECTTLDGMKSRRSMKTTTAAYSTERKIVTMCLPVCHKVIQYELSSQVFVSPTRHKDDSEVDDVSNNTFIFLPEVVR